MRIVPEALGAPSRPSPLAELEVPERTVRRCLACGSREVHTDAVEQRGWLLLAECRHCDHRWTSPLSEQPAPGVVRAGIPRPSEVVRAA